MLNQSIIGAFSTRFPSHHRPATGTKSFLGPFHGGFRYWFAPHPDVSDLSDAVGVVVLFVSLGVGGLSLVLLRGNARLGAILSAFAQVTVIPERRRRFLLLLWVEAVCFLATGVLFGLNDLGVQVTADPDLLVAIAFLAGMVTLGALVWVGLSPRPLTAMERTTAEKDAPTILESLWTVPYRQSEAQRRPPRKP
jgi:hypothetical protein